MTELPPPELFTEIYRRHGHRCPMSTLGGRLGWAAQRRLGGADGEGRSAIFFHATCAVDGIAVATGCCLATGTLAVRDLGRHALVLRDRRRGAEVEVRLRPAALAIAARHRRFQADLERRREGLSAEELRLAEAEGERVLQEVLEQLWTRTDGELLTFGGEG